MKNETFAEVVATKSYTSGTRTMVNHNKMLRLYPDAIGVKTGYTMTAGRCLVSAAKRNGRTVIAVTLNDRNDWNDHVQMLEDAFAGMQEQQWAKKGDMVCSIPVQTGTDRAVDAVYAESLSGFLLQGETAELEVFCVDFLYAPVKPGTVCGTARVVCGDTVLGETELLCGSEVQLDTAQEDLSRKERFLLWWDRLRKRIVT